MTGEAPEDPPNRARRIGALLALLGAFLVGRHLMRLDPALKPDSLHGAVGLLRYELRDYAGAAASYRADLRGRCGSLGLRLDADQLDLVCGTAEDAEAAAVRRLADSPGSLAYWAGENMALQGYEAEAVALLTRAVALEPDRYTSFRLAWVLTRMGESTRAIDVIDESALQYPDAWEFPFLKAYNLLKTAQYDGAVESLERVERLRPGVPGVQDTLERLRAHERVVP